jgi:lincosamide and streptogramin A transport system ATP-binding/permease protein
MSLINISNLTFSYEGCYDNIFENVNFQIDTNWKLGFVGRNGRGKTTFLNLLLGKYVYEGSISSSVDFEYFPFEVEDKTEFTIDVIKRYACNIEDWQIIREINLLDLSDEILYRSFETLSNGERTKVLLVALFLKENNFLLIDEPTNHLDLNSRKIVSEYLSRKKGFILISHDRAFLDGCVDHILSINKENIEVQKGDFSSWIKNKEMQDNFEVSKNEKLKKEIKRLSESAKRTAEWSDKAESRKIGFDPSKVEKNISRRPTEAAKAKKMMSRSKAIQERKTSIMDDKSKLLKNIENSAELKLSPLKFHTPNLITVNKLNVFYGEKRVCENISFSVNEGDRISISGKNGSGKSSILKLICGENISYTGDVFMNKQLKISYVQQNTESLSGSLVEYAGKYGIDLSLFLAILRKLDFSRSQFEKDILFFSEGQKKKVLIARSLCEKVHLYIWDEPLNFIDLISRMQIEKLILEYKPTIIFVEHDKFFTDNIATNVISI